MKSVTEGVFDETFTHFWTNNSNPVIPNMTSDLLVLLIIDMNWTVNPAGEERLYMLLLT